MAIVNTGKYLETGVAERLKTMHHHASTCPAIVLRPNPPPGEEYPVDEATMAWRRFYKDMNAAAVAAGLPEPRMYVDEDGDECRIDYGADFSTREILGWEPDA